MGERWEKEGSHGTTESTKNKIFSSCYKDCGHFFSWLACCISSDYSLDTVVRFDQRNEYREMMSKKQSSQMLMSNHPSQPEKFRTLSVDTCDEKIAGEVRLFFNETHSMPLSRLEEGLDFIKHYPRKKKGTPVPETPVLENTFFVDIPEKKPPLRPPRKKTLYLKLEGGLPRLSWESRWGSHKTLAIDDIVEVVVGGFVGCPYEVMDKTVSLETERSELVMQLANTEELERFLVTLDYLRYCLSNQLHPKEFWLEHGQKSAESPDSQDSLFFQESKSPDKIVGGIC